MKAKYAFDDTKEAYRLAMRLLMPKTICVNSQSDGGTFSLIYFTRYNIITVN